MLVDNADIQQKIIIRNKLFDYPFISTRNCIEYFGGKGVIRRLFWEKVCDNVTSIDILQSDGIDVVGDAWDNIHLSKNVELIDCDAYGQVIDFIAEIISITNVNKMIFFTDGSAKIDKYKKSGFLEKIKSLSNEYHFEKSKYANVYYGYLIFRTYV